MLVRQMCVCVCWQLNVPKEADASQTDVCVCVCVCWQLNVPKEADASQTVGFRSLLLNKCQQEFEKDKVEELDIAERQKLIDEATSVSSPHTSRAGINV